MANSRVTQSFNNIIPQEINSDIKITKGITLKAMVTIIAVFFISEQFRALVHPNLQLLYSIFCLCISVVMVVPSGKNPGKQLHNALLYTFFKDKTVYHPIKEVLQIGEGEKE